MADIINLRSRRKAAERQRRSDLASENRIKFGRTREERKRDLLERSNHERTLDGARRADQKRDNETDSST